MIYDHKVVAEDCSHVLLMHYEHFVGTLTATSVTAVLQGFIAPNQK